MPAFSSQKIQMLVLAVVVSCGTSTAMAIGPRITASPHDEQHLLIVRPNELVTSDYKTPRLVEDPRATFIPGPTAPTALVPVTAPIDQPLFHELRVKHPGKYAIWVRVTQRLGRPTPVKVELKTAGKIVLQETIHTGPGSPALGGPAAYAAYQEIAKKNTPKGAVASLESQRFALGNDEPTSGGKKVAAKSALPAADDLGDDLLEELREKPADPWAHLARLEELDDQQPGYWWKAGVVDLAAGRYELHLSPAATLPRKPEDAPRFDAALLSTFQELTYPYAGDIGESRATFVRFRLDKLPKTGVRLGAAIQTHVLQHPRLSVRFGREVIDKDDLHTDTGFTCWYRLQDIKWMPAATKHEVGIRIEVNGAGGINQPASGYAGATQFASFPHPDFVVREFDWLEPQGLNYTCALDVEHYAHRLMNFRDHAREHYQTALAAAKRISPLVRGELYFTTICGSAGPDDRDYMLKTMRLLGINSLSETEHDGLGPRLFGWNRAHFSATMPLGDLFDEKQARQHYDDYFREIFSKNQDEWKDTWSYCYFDEPGELYREEMTGPYWQYVEDAEQPYWYDPVGNSALHIKRTELPRDCVLEGIVERTSTVEFRVGLDNLQQPKEYRLWALGNNLGPAINSNLAFGKYIEGSKVPTVGYRYVRSLGTNLGQLKFKIVYQQGVATLFINDRTIDQQVDLPLNPSFGIGGGPKKIYALRLRPMKPNEGVKLDGAPANDDDVAELGKAVLEELELDDLPAWARPKPLKQFVEDECLYAGGVPGVAKAFHAWLQEQQLSPEFFGKASWDDIRPLTLAELVQNEHEARLYYWSRRFSSQLTPRNFALISEAIHRHAPNPKMWSYAALSGGVIYRAKQMPLDMFHVGSLGNTATGGISDWMFYSTWRWDSHQAVAYSAELYNTGARRHGSRPVSFPMMHCVAPTSFRAFTQLGAQVKLMSLYSYGPRYLNYPDSWAESPGPYDAIARLTAKAAPADDILAPGVRRPSRVALLYPHSTEYWSTENSFDDRRATFLALSHEYFQPEVVTEQQILSGALDHYDALYVVDRHVASKVQSQIKAWVEAGGLLWSCADALTRDEYNQPADLLGAWAGIARSWPADAFVEKKEKRNTVPPPLGAEIVSAEEPPSFDAHRVLAAGVPAEVELAPECKVLARYRGGKGLPGWCERSLGKGHVVYIGHRAGATYTGKNIMVSGHRALWADTGRRLLTAPLLKHKIPRELVLSELAIVASPISSEAGTAIVLYNMRARERANVEVSLREPERPRSVTRLVDHRLEELPFDYVDGIVKFRIPLLDEEDIVYVRRGNSDDDRLDVMRRRTEQQLASDEVESLSAGAWVASFYPPWNLAARIQPLLNHADWRVRRSAAEAIGRLRQAAAGDTLAELAAHEHDPHVVAEQLATLALLRHKQLVEVALRRLDDPRFVVRQAALRALGDRLSAADATSVDAASAETELPAQAVAAIGKAAKKLLGDSDQRVRREAMRIVARLEPAAAAQQMLSAFADRQLLAELDRPLWAEAIAADDEAFAAFWQLDAPLELPLLLELGKLRRDPRLAAALVEQVRHVTEDNGYAWSLAMIKQQDSAAARRLLAMRAELPPRALYYLPLVLEHTFELGCGNDVDAWVAKLAQ